MSDVDGKLYTVGAPADLLYPVSGSSADWAKSIGIKYAYSIELRGDMNDTHRFELPAEYIVVTAEEAKAATFVFAEHVTRARLSVWDE